MYIKKIISYVIMIIICFLLQTSLFPYFKLASVVPNLLMILTATIAITSGSVEGSITGFICGLLLDLFCGQYIGLYALGYLLAGYLIGICNRIFYKEDITFPIMMIAAADFFWGLYVYIFGFLIRGRLNILYYLRRIILPEIAYTVIISIFLYKILALIIERLSKKGSDNYIA